MITKMIIKKNIKGFTLVELLFTITIGLLLLSAIYVAVQSGQRSSIALEQKVTAQQDVRAALEIMALEISMASYNPLFQPTTMWVAPPDGVVVPANRGFQEATANSITVEMDIGGSSGSTNPTGVVGDGNNEVIRYIYDTATQRITRSTNYSGNFDFLGCTDANGDGRCDNNQSLRNVMVVNNTLAIPMFRYFDGTNTETANIPDIRRVDITIAIDSDVIDPNTGQRRRMIYSTSVIPRNHAITGF
jgi:prepilin-type N-terminal cleavage/methylation domain-containing protein